MRVYLAGKINQNDWRNSLDGYRAFSVPAGDVVDDENDSNAYAQDFENFFGELPVICKHPYIEVTGPFFLSCDHGCYHGDGSHGVGAVEEKDFNHGSPGGCEGFTFSQAEVARICLNQIRKSDMVFAYINNPTCYGTLFELGYAEKAGKTIAVLFDDPMLAEIMWFIRERASIVLTIEHASHGIGLVRYPEGVKEAIWIANRISKELYGKPLWRYRDSTTTEEESVFYPNVCHLTPKEQYQEYLKTSWWQKVRVERLKIDGYKCACCGTEKNLQVHHTDYSKGWFHEDPRQDLITLCKKCHEEKVHGNK